MDNKTAIITGGHGQDGSLLASLLLNKGYKVVSVIRSRNGNDWRWKELGLYSNPNFFVEVADINDGTQIGGLVCKYGPQEFYHLAAKSFVGDSWHAPSSYIQTNVLGTINCLEAIKHFMPNCRFYNAASSEMFGGANREESLNEQSSFEPRSPYAVSKVASYNACINYRQSYSLHISNGILFNHEGPWRGLEFVTRKITDGVAKIYLGIENKIILGNLDSKRDWGSSRDFVEAMYLMLQQENPDDYVIATGEVHSISDLCEIAFEVIHLENWKNFIETNDKYCRPTDVNYLCGDYTKAKKILKWEPKISFKEMIKEMVMKDIERLKQDDRAKWYKKMS